MDSSVKSATRVFDILELFREAQKPLRLGNISDHFGYPPSSVLGILKTMIMRGYLNFDSNTRLYFPTGKLLELVSWLPNFEGSVMEAMKNLQQNTSEMIVLGAISDIYVEYVNVLRSTHEIQLWSPPGTKRLLVANGMGFLLLSQIMGQGSSSKSRDQVIEIFRKTCKLGLVKEDDFPLEDLISRLTEVDQNDYLFSRSRADGYPAMSEEEVRSGPGNPGGAMISMLIPCPPNQRPLALGVAGPAERLIKNLDQNVAQLRQQIKFLGQIAYGGSA